MRTRYQDGRQYQQFGVGRVAKRVLASKEFYDRMCAVLCHDNKRAVSAGTAPHVTYGSNVYCVCICSRLILVTL